LRSLGVLLPLGALLPELLLELLPEVLDPPPDDFSADLLELDLSELVAGFALEGAPESALPLPPSLLDETDSPPLSEFAEEAEESGRAPLRP
jgi:hypothetical protein